MPNLERVFISHSHTDTLLAQAFKKAITNIFGHAQVGFSSDKDADGGIQGGENWLSWIHRQVADCQEALVLLTPYSVAKPWPMWEAGAVGGASLASDQQKTLTPVVFQLSGTLPGPFVVTQKVDGQSEADLARLLAIWMERYDYAGRKASTTKPLLETYVPQLKTAIDAALQDTPPPVTEATIVEWCRRLDELRSANRASETRHLHRWIRLMFEGPSAGNLPSRQTGQRYTWDIRLHLRLGDLYLQANKHAECIEQLQIAKSIAPLDIFVLHRLAKAYMDAGRQDEARVVIDRILTLDADALLWNTEVAGLEGRYWKDKGDLHRAREAYRGALGQNPSDTYLLDNVGQLSLELGEHDVARQSYARLLKILADAEVNVWTLAARATAQIVVSPTPASDNTINETLLEIGKIVKPHEATSITRGLQSVASALAIDEQTLAAWTAALQRTQ